MALTKFQDMPSPQKQRVLNHAWLCKGNADNEFYFLEVDPTTGNLPISVTVNFPTRAKAWNAFLDYSSSNVGTGAYVQVVASTAAAASVLNIFDGGGNPMVIAFGAAASEVDEVYIPPGGWDAPIEIVVPINTRVSIKSLNGTSNLGFLVISAQT